MQTPGASDPGAYKKLPSYVAVEQWGREPRLDPSRKPGDSITASDALLAAQFWAYDGTVNLCAPARLYNQIAARVLDHLETTAADGYPVMNIQSVTDVARFYALVNIAMADAAIAAWDAKYHFQFPRPVTYIRAENTLAAAGTIITKWFPVGAQNTNSDQTFNITPPFPAYPSGHAVFGGALFGILRQYLKPGTEFGFLSDEFNGKNKDAFNYVRCSENDVFTPKGSKFCSERKFTIDCAERENADSRIFMGVHWVFDADDGIYMGNQVAKQVYRYAMNPIDQNGQLQVPQSHVFSVDQAVVKKRKDAVCPGITFPAGWDNENETMGFGPLNLKGVPPF